MRRMLAAAMLAAGLCGCAAAWTAPAAPAYVVLEENASIPFADRAITSFRVGQDRSVILRVMGNRYYRGTLDPMCRRDLDRSFAIGLAAGQSTFDRFGWLLIDGRRCQMTSLDEIADPSQRPERNPS